MKRKINFNEQQLTLPFGQGRVMAFSYEHRAKTFWILSAACLLSLVSYVYAVNATAHNVSQRASLEREATELNTELATLEFQYIGLKSGVTLETAHEYGFTEVEKPLYVSRGEGRGSLSFNTQSR
jgi:hypothetical protein